MNFVNSAPGKTKDKKAKKESNFLIGFSD